MKDNVDPEPTVGNPCTVTFTSKDNEKGSVSLGTVETVGGTVLSVTTTPTFKYEFSKWIDTAGITVSTTAQWDVVAQKDTTYTAVFVKRKQPITKQATGGSISAVSSAEIDSTVSVSINENAGYVYTPGSLAYNGIPVENGSFIMPDEPVVLTAEFVRNEHYFALNDILTAAKGYSYQAYSKESFAVLTAAINEAKAALVNAITQEESEKHIAALQAAMDGLADKYVTVIAPKSGSVFYLNVPDMMNTVSIVVTYDNGTTATVTGADCVVEGYDATRLGEQEVHITYGGFTDTVTVTVEKRRIDECTVAAIADVLFDGVSTQYTPTPTITYSRAEDTLVEGVDYTLSYTNNVRPGKATLTVTGIGDYTGTQTVTFKITCKHDFDITGRVESTCTQQGGFTGCCTICGEEKSYATVVTEGLPETSHPYSNSMNQWYEYSNDGASSLLLAFSPQTLTETNCDYIYIYDGSDNLIGTYSGYALAGKTVSVPDDTVHIRFTSSRWSGYYGFSFDSITAYFDELLLPLAEHPYGEWEVITPATENATGSRRHVCTVCNHEEVVDIPVIQTVQNTSKGNAQFTVSSIADGTHKLSVSGTGAMPVWSTLGIYDYATTITEVEIADGITGLPYAAFQNMKALKKVTLPPTVTSLPNLTFSGCTALTSIDLSHVKTMGNKVFMGSGLTEVTLANNTTLGDAVFYGCKSLVSADLGNVICYNKGNPKYWVPTQTFANCSALKNVTFGNKVSIIYTAAFRNTGLESITIPGTVKTISSNAFGTNKRLKTVVLEEGVKTIGYTAFAACTALEEVALPDSVIGVSTAAFYSCYGIKKLTIGAGIAKTYNDMFMDARSLEEITLPDTMTELANRTFYKCGVLKAIDLPTELTRIGKTAFYFCSELKEITIPEKVTSIGDNAFDGCDRLKTVYVDSATVAASLANNKSMGHVARYAKTVCVRSDITTVGTYITDNFTAGETVIVNGVEYVMYTKN